MQGISIFKQIYAPRVSHVVTGFDGVSHPTHSPYALGEVVGNVGKMAAIVANNQADTWHVVNLKCGNLFDAVAVLGAFDESEAANMAMRCHGQYFDAVCGDVYESNTGGLQRFLNHPVYMRTNRPVYAEELAKLQDLASTQAILWDDARLKSHNGSSKVLLLDMMRCDDNKALLDKIDLEKEESELDGEIAEYDALVVEAYKLENTVSKLALAMDKATSISTLKVANQTLSKPKTMRGFGVIQQLVSFELSDGQAVSIIFNVSDSEANASAKMTKDDLLVAWKYKLNSRDITAAVQPNATQNVSLNMIASRIMGLADANSEKFVAAQNKKSAMQAEFADSNERVKGLQGQEQALVQEIADLQKQLDEAGKQVANDYSKYPVIATDDRYGQIIEVPTIWGDKVRVAKRQLENSGRTLLKRFTKAGVEIDGDSIHRENLLIGNAKLTATAQIEKELKEKGYKVAPFPKSKQQELKLIDAGYIGYSLDGKGWIKPSFSLAVIYAIPPVVTDDQQLPSTFDFSGVSKVSKPANRFAEHDTIAKQYGYSVDNNGVIFTPKGKDTGVKIESPTGRLKISNAKDTLFTGVNPTGLAKFLESYWYAEKTKAGVVPPVDDGRITPDIAGNMKNGDIVRTKDGTEFMSLGARHDWLEVAPMINGKPRVNSEDTFKFLLSPEKADAYPERRNEPIYQTGKNYYNDNKGQEPVAPVDAQNRPSNWRTNLANARAVANSLGLETNGKKLDRLVKDIDIFDENEVKKELLAEFKALASRLTLPKGYVFDLSDAEKAIGDISRWVSPVIRKQGKIDTKTIRIELRATPDSSQDVIFSSVHFYTDDKDTKKELDKLNYQNFDSIGRSEAITPKAIVEKMEQFLTKAVLPKIEYLRVVNSTSVDVSKLAEIGIAEITDLGDENIYFEKDGKHYISKVGNTENYALGEWDFAKYPEGKPVEPVTQPEPVSEQPMTNPDKDYLQSIIDGEDMGLAPKEITAKIREIVIAAKTNADTDILDLANKAAKAYSEQVKAKAVAKLAGVQ